MPDKPFITIDCEPTWRSLLPILIDAHNKGCPEATAELNRLAEIADAVRYAQKNVRTMTASELPNPDPKQKKFICPKCMGSGIDEKHLWPEGFPAARELCEGYGEVDEATLQKFGKATSAVSTSSEENQMLDTRDQLLNVFVKAQAMRDHQKKHGRTNTTAYRELTAALNSEMAGKMWAYLKRYGALVPTALTTKLTEQPTHTRIHSHSNMNHSGYLQHSFDPHNRPETIRHLLARIKASGIEFDLIVCRGVSGLSITPTIADALNKPFAFVRKEQEKNYSHAVEGVESPKMRWLRYIIIDDLIGSGDTIRKIVDKCNGGGEGLRTCVGIFLYNDEYGHNGSIRSNNYEDKAYTIPVSPRHDTEEPDRLPERMKMRVEGLSNYAIRDYEIETFQRRGIGLFPV